MRSRILSAGKTKKGKVVYWMSREHRVYDNWSLLFAQDLGDIEVVFCLVPEFLGATYRQYKFMLDGLKVVEKQLRELKIPFRILTGDPIAELPKLDCRAIVTDFDPLRIKKQWKLGVIDKVDVPVYEVDSHNIVPCWVASQKQEFAARTIRPKILRQLSYYLKEFPRPRKQKGAAETIDWQKLWKKIKVDMDVADTGLKAGPLEAEKAMKRFLARIGRYDKRNDPNADATSGLSPYLHFGHISAQRVALSTDDPAFLEQLVIRKELADNYCHHNENYDNIKGVPDWAKKTLDEHRKDKRVNYSLKQLEEADTHDDLWNAAQLQMVKTGYMHGYMRMYWAKKILEWSKTPEEAMKTAIYLNDRYELDGRDPNGYTGIAWSIGGVHDRAWTERAVFGKVRYMNYNGAKRKFDVKSYVDRWL